MTNIYDPAYMLRAYAAARQLGMKVLVISHNCISRTMGQPRLHCLAAYPDIEVAVIVPDKLYSYGSWQSVEYPENAEFEFYVGRTRWRSIRNQWYMQHYADTLSSVINNFQPDIVDIWQEPWSLTSAQVIWHTRRLCPKAKIVSETEQNIYKRLPPPFAQFQSYSLHHADFLIARNQEAADVVKRKGYTGPVGVIPNAVDCDLFTPATPTIRYKTRAASGWGNAESFVIGYVGRLVPEKGLADAISALATLPHQAQLVLVGEGPMQTELEGQARSLGLQDRVHFTGSQPLASLPALMNGMDVLILPSHTTARWKEQFGRVLIEAGACGIAVVGSDSGAIPEVIGNAGLIHHEGDIESLASCLHSLATDPGLRARYGAAGRKQALELYSWQRVASQMRKVFTTVLDKAMMPCYD